MLTEREYLAAKAKLMDEARALNATAEAETRDFTADEQKTWDKNQESLKSLDNRWARAQALGNEDEDELSGTPMKPRQAPGVLKGKRGDNLPNALAAYIRKGDKGGVREMLVGENDEVEIRASNATDMNIGTAADGGYAVPTGFYPQIIARRDEMALPVALGVRKIPGKGTTVNVPLDGEDDGEFVSTAEAGTFDEDAPALGQAAMTLVKYSKYTPLSVELLEDEDANIMAFLADFFARGYAKTLNSLLLAEAANGTNLKTLASTTAFASGEIEAMAYNDAVANYLDDSQSVAWVTRASTYAGIRSLAGNPHIYAETPVGLGSGPSLLSYPVKFSVKTPAPTAGLKSMFFGNWNYMGWRDADSFTMLRDPFSKASTGQITLWMYVRTVFKVLQAEAIGYATQAAS